MPATSMKPATAAVVGVATRSAGPTAGLLSIVATRASLVTAETGLDGIRLASVTSR